VLRDAGGRESGAVVVLNDVTRLKRLETVRRDFVANVSHELKTPVTAVKAAVETLQGGALHDAAEAARFTEMIVRQADRLGSIIEDLLSLSRIEQEEEGAGLALAREAIGPVLAAAAQACAPSAAARSVGIAVRCPEDLRAAINPQLLENAVVNLIDNAVKHSEPGREVVVEGTAEEGGTVIRVIDRGCGIEPRHLPRLFERFYRVDRARSRRLGGTGLGLAIVKHIVQAHRGEVSVESQLGEGSTFTIRLPAS
jgi:two-component system phosphate regulon sensor histidine kinase PhoR